MNAYLHQKISLGREKSASSLAWNGENDLVAIGYDSGAVKLIKVEEAEQEAGLQLATNENLGGGHAAPIARLAWNESKGKLLSLDARGLLVVWGERLGAYLEDMVNESPDNRIRLAAWSVDGASVLLALESGALILGSAEGQRLWRHEFGLAAAHACFTEDDRVIVVADERGALLAVDVALGETFAEAELPEEAPAPGGRAQSVVAFECTQSADSRLLIARGSGIFYLSGSLRRGLIRRFDYGLEEVWAGGWSPACDRFALSARKGAQPCVALFAAGGELQRFVALPRPAMQVRFNGAADRLLAVGGNSLSYIRAIPAPLMCFLPRSGALFVREGNELWRMKAPRAQMAAPEAVFVLGHAERVLLVCRAGAEARAQLLSPALSQLAALRLPRAPDHAALGDGAAVFGFGATVAVWDFGLAARRVLWVSLAAPDRPVDATLLELSPPAEREDDARLCCLALCGTTLAAATSRGALLVFNAPSLALEATLDLPRAARYLALAPDLACLALIDVHGVLSFWDFRVRPLRELREAVRDAGAVIWATGGQGFAVTVKNRVLQSASLASALQEVCAEAHLLAMDELWLHTAGRERFAAIEADRWPTAASQRWREAAGAALACGRGVDQLAGAPPGVQRHFAEEWLQQLRFEQAAALYRRLEDLAALRFIQRAAQTAESDALKAAAALFFLGREEEAYGLLTSQQLTPALIKLASATGRLPLLERLRRLLDGPAQAELARQRVRGLLAQGDAAAAVQAAAPLGRERLECLLRARDFAGLSALLEASRDKEELRALAAGLARLGAVDWAARALERAGEARAGLELALKHQLWSTAVEIAERNNFHQIENLVARFAADLGAQHKKFELVELYRKAQKHAEAANLLNAIAEDMNGAALSPLLIKKVFVLAALEANLHSKKAAHPTLTAQLTKITLKDYKELTRQTLDTLTAAGDDRALVNPWRGAEAWHLLCLALRRLQRGEHRQALCAARKLPLFQAEVGAAKAYSLWALAAFRAAQFAECGRALTSLERQLRAAGSADIEKLFDLRVYLFAPGRRDVVLAPGKALPCPAKDCGASVTEEEPVCPRCRLVFKFCVVSGKSILTRDSEKCPCCKHKMIRDELQRARLRHCPLCHYLLRFPPPEVTNDA